MSHDTRDPDEARHRLYDIMRTDAPFDRKVEQALHLGKAYLGVDHAHLTRIDPQSDYWEAIASTDSEDGPFPTGLVVDLQTSYCLRTIRGGDSVAVSDAPAQGWADDPAFETHGLHCYHGTPIRVDDDTYGTVCFVSETPREPFTDGDTMFAELVARMLEHELERSHHDAELTRRSNLINVLNRVLRHNLRNTMSIIRGRAQMIADQYDDDASQVILNRADQLIALSEKARKLESVIVNEGDRQDTDLQTLLTQVVDDVATDYPAATITVDAPASVSLAVRPGLRMAVRELVENAAKHAGTDPTVTVSFEASPNDVVISISDDGPGLSEMERQVLTDGIETPLTHGTGMGLWLAYWIVTGHEGTIEATVSGGGTRMQLRLPRDVPSTPPTDDTQRERIISRVQDTFRAVFDESFDAMVIAADESYILEANRMAADLLGVPADDLRGIPLTEFINDDTVGESIWHSAGDTSRKRETVPIVRDDGTERVVECATTAGILPGHHLALMRDVTERETQREELQEERAFIDQALDTLNDLFYVVDLDGGLRRWNQRVRELTGYDDETLADMDAVEFVPEADRERIADAVEETLTGGDITVEAEILTADGERVPHEFIGARLTDTEGTVTGLVGIGRDITERRERERELEVAETIFQNTQDAIFLVDVTDQQEFRIQRVNEAYEEVTGLSNDDIRGATPRDVVGEETGSDIEARYRECIERGETIEYPEAIPVDGEDRYWQTKLTPVVEDGTVSKLIGAMRDVTSRDRSA